MNQGQTPPIPVYGAFRALYAQKQDLRNASEQDRVEALTAIVATIHSYLPNNVRIEAVPTATTPQEKQALLDNQKAEGREGVVWTRRDCSYTPGDQTEITCRTKFLQEEEFTVVSISRSKTQNRMIASLELADTNGNPVGNVGTGFDQTTATEILQKHEERPGSLQVLVRFQGWTEKKSLWHPRFVCIV
jgi:ATP-dependent DNA ligase